VQANQLPEYELSLHRNADGEVIVQFVHRSHLAVDHPHREERRFPMRRQTGGIFSKAVTFNATPDGDDDDE
jgi:hypothetical protein